MQKLPLTMHIPKSFFLTSAQTPFPNVDFALEKPNGLIAVGGELTSKRLLQAYQQGIFPWYSEGEPVLWYSPNPRMVMTRDKLHLSKSLQKTLNRQQFEVRFDTDFTQVIHQCRHIKRAHQNGTWIDADMTHAYTKLHHQGFARSVEVYENNQLVGGLYGVAMGRVFFGESMFSKVSNASKIALVYLLNNTDYQLIDCQVENPYLQSLGAFNLERSVFIQLLARFV